ncbi:zinc-ribbon domain-containing protein [Georgenia sp. SUBG003]|uniref:zinc-ribbon domain-containing protein n=1 Tax=Georgenia sp. SUBG003 TaxID=1497974 RepID=UPI003AB8B846
MVTAGSGRKAYWQCPREHAFEAVIVKRVSGSGCPICANRKVLAGFNDLATRHPEIAADWHPTKNAPLAPVDVVAGNLACAPAVSPPTM